MADLQAQPSQAKSSYWDDENMANWGVQKKLKTIAPTPSPSTAAISAQVTPSPPSEEPQGKSIPAPWIPPHIRGIQNTQSPLTTKIPEAAKDSPSTANSTMAVSTLPYLPPHLAAIRDSTILPVADIEALLATFTISQTIVKDVPTPPPSRPQSRSTNKSSAPQSRSTSISTQPSRPSSFTPYQRYSPFQNLPPPEVDHAGAASLRSWLDNDTTRPSWNSNYSRQARYPSYTKSRPVTPTSTTSDKENDLTPTSNSSRQAYYQPHTKSRPVTPSSSSPDNENMPTPTRARYGDKGYVPPATRPKKSMDMAQRMIYHDLGIKMPRKTSPTPEPNKETSPEPESKISPEPARETSLQSTW